MSKLPEILRLTRNDLSNLLIHFTRASEDSTAFDVLKTIISAKKLCDRTGYIRGGLDQRCVCFTESPINEMVTYFNLEKIVDETRPSIRYESYGIAFQKNYLFNEGARPVIYQPQEERRLLPEELRYRHVTYNPSAKIDFTWEREWRFKTASLDIVPSQAIIIVPTFEKAYHLIQQFQSGEIDYATERDEDGEYTATPCGISYYCDWKIVSLDLFGLE